jgi:hypothetical protein
MNSVVVQNAVAALVMGLQRLRSWVPGTSPGMTIKKAKGPVIEPPA